MISDSQPVSFIGDFIISAHGGYRPVLRIGTIATILIERSAGCGSAAGYIDIFTAVEVHDGIVPV